MNFVDTVYNDTLQKISRQLKDKLLNSSTQEKIKTEINTNWNSSFKILSNTLMAIITVVVEKNIPSISVIETNDDEFGAKLSYSEPDSTVYVDIKSLAHTSGIFKILRLKDKVAFIEDFLIYVINQVMHELIHYYDVIEKRKTTSFDDIYRAKMKLIAKVKSDLDDQDYLEDESEMKSFSHGIIQNLKLKGYTQNEVLQIINIGKDSEGFEPSEDFSGYYNRKDTIKNWPVFVKLLRDYATKHWEEI